MRATSDSPQKRPQSSHATPAPRVWRTIYVRAVADKAPLVGILAFYAMAIAVGVAALWLPLLDTFATIADDLPPAFDGLMGGLSIATPSGWMNAELLSIVGPGFAIAAAMISAAAATAAEEQSRTLSLVLSTGIKRSTFLAAKAIAALTHVLIVSLAVLLGMLIANPVGNLDLPISGLIAATVNITLVALLAGAISLTLGVLTGNKKQTPAGTGVAVQTELLVPLPGESRRRERHRLGLHRHPAGPDHRHRRRGVLRFP